MINHRPNEIVIVDGLKDYLSTKERPCEVVRQNQVVEAPDYPYVSYTVTTVANEFKGTYSEAENGTLYRDAIQTWSLTVQSDDEDEALNLGLKMLSYFTVVGLTILADKGITVRRVTGLTVRDNLLSIQYEHRMGLDVMFGLLYAITPDEFVTRDKIETFDFKEV